MSTRLPIEESNSRDFWDEQHQAQASSQISWVLTADELLRSFSLLARQAEVDARKLFEDRRGSPVYVPQVSSVALMIGALAIENLLKGIRVEQIQQVFDQRGRFILATHDLLRLADDAQVSLSEEDRILLERLQEFSTWGGRYPVPKKSEDLLPRKFPHGGVGPRTAHNIPGDFTAVQSLCDRLREMLPKIE